VRLREEIESQKNAVCKGCDTLRSSLEDEKEASQIITSASSSDP